MAITQLNPTDFNYAKLLETLNKAYKTQADITLSNFDNSLAPQVKAGSIFADSGALFKNDADVTPTGYAGIPNSTTFYLYYDADGTKLFIYSATVPTWSDALQGWYNGNNRAFFSMFKDAGGTLYQNKSLMINQSNHQIDGDLTITGGIDIGSSGVKLKIKVVEISISASTGGSVAHGLDQSKIRGLAANVVFASSVSINGVWSTSTQVVIDMGNSITATAYVTIFYID